jgi:hypothetical protein
MDPSVRLCISETLETLEWRFLVLEYPARESPIARSLPAGWLSSMGFPHRPELPDPYPRLIHALHTRPEPGSSLEYL